LRLDGAEHVSVSGGLKLDFQLKTTVCEQDLNSSLRRVFARISVNEHMAIYRQLTTVIQNSSWH